jgi:hypothetical protein
MTDWHKPIYRDDGTEVVVDPCRVSVHVVGVFPSGIVFIKPLNPQRIWEDLDTFEVHSLLVFMCIEAVDESDPDTPAQLIGVVRVQHEGEHLACYHTYLSSDIKHQGDYIPTDQQIGVMQGAVLRIMVSGTGHIDEADGAERAIEGVQILEQLGLGE